MTATHTSRRMGGINANDQGNDYSSVAYWYQLEPHKSLPPLPPVSDRLPARWPEHGLWDR